MKKLVLVLIPIILLLIGVFAFRAPKTVDAAKGDRADYTLDPWTFYQTGVSTDGWNPWELSAFQRVYFPDDSDKFADSTPGKQFNPRVYDQNNHKFDHATAGTHPKNDERTVIADGVAHGYVATIERNGWSGKWLPDEEEDSDDPPKWGQPITPKPETTSFEPYLIDNNPYTVRSWVTARGLKRNRSYTWKFDAYIDEGAYMAKLGGNVEVDNKYVKIVGTTESGTILFVRYLSFTTKKQTFMFNFDMDANNTAVKVEYMYGAFLKEGPIIKHEEVVWTGTVHVENCDIIQGNMLLADETTTARRRSSGGGDWEEEPEKITGVKVKSKAKKSAKVSWSSDDYATKYQVNYALKSSFKGGKKKKTSKCSLTIKGLKSKKTYYFRVRGMNDEYTGSWSKKKKCKIK